MDLKIVFRIVGITGLLLLAVVAVHFITLQKRRPAAPPVPSLPAPSSPAAVPIGVTSRPLSPPMNSSTPPRPRVSQPPPPAPTASADPSSVVSFPGSQRVVWDAVRGASRAAFRDGLYFDQSKKQLVPISGFKAPLLPHECSTSELVCHPDSVIVKRRSARNDVPWVLDAFQAKDVLVDSTTALKPGRQLLRRWFGASDLDGISDALLDEYAAWLFQTSWLFRQFLAWKPHPVPVAVDGTGAQQQKQQFRARHDPRSYQLYVLENFCVGARNGGLSVLNNTVAPQRELYVGRDDTRGARHEDVAFRRFFNTGSLLAPNSTAPSPAAAHVDERPVVFMPLDRHHRVNFYHTVVRYLSLSGILNPSIFPFSDSSLAPLLIFVCDAEKDVTKAPVWALLFRLLDLPVAAVFSSGEDLSHDLLHRTACQRSDGYHGLCNLTANQLGQQTEPRLCFRRGVAWQSCWGGWELPAEEDGKRRCKTTLTPFDDAEPYSFGDFAPLTPNRRKMLRTFVVSTSSCLPPPPAAAAVAGASTTPRLPRLFFSVRTHARRVRLLPLFLDSIISAVKGAFVSDVLVRETLRGSRTKYLEDIRRSNIWLGMHGASEVHIALMPTRSVVIELNTPYQFGSAAAVDSNLGKGWFTFASRFTHSFHSVTQVSAEYHRGTSFFVAPRTLIKLIKQAACRWLVEHRVINLNLQQQQQHRPAARKPGRLARECAVIGLQKEQHLDILQPGEFSGETCLQLLNTLFAGRNTTSLSNCRAIASALMALTNDFGSIPSIKFQSRSFPVWQPLVSLIVGDEANKVTDIAAPVTTTSSFRLLGCFEEKALLSTEGVDFDSYGGRSEARFGSCLFLGR